jgi:hypothetical protein
MLAEGLGVYGRKKQMVGTRNFYQPRCFFGVARLFSQRGRCVLMLRSRAGALYEVMVGLEFHVALSTRSKLLSGAAAHVPGAPPNTLVAPFDAAHPGTLPRLNGGAVAQGLRAALALHAAVPRLSSFQRKHYFYADLPHGYQVTQLDEPLALGGFLPFRLPLPAQGQQAPAAAAAAHPFGVARIARLQLEMDSGKSNHTLVPGASVVDLNRAGAALLEVVTEPDLRGAEEAAALVAAPSPLPLPLLLPQGPSAAWLPWAWTCALPTRALRQTLRGRLGWRAGAR